MEDEKVFGLGWILFMMFVAFANDLAEIIFDLLDFTGVGISGELIMEPVNIVLDAFFTGIFIWKQGWGGATITQYVGDVLEPLLLPTRMASVAVGIWVANNPNTQIAGAVNAAASLEKGDLQGAVAGATAGAQGAQGDAGQDSGGRRYIQDGDQEPGQYELSGPIGDEGGDMQTEGGSTVINGGYGSSGAQTGGSATGNGAPGTDPMLLEAEKSPIDSAMSEEFSPQIEAGGGGGAKVLQMPKPKNNGPQVSDVKKPKPPFKKAA